MTPRVGNILMSGPMVRALLREVDAPGTGKTQTRRLAWKRCKKQTGNRGMLRTLVDETGSHVERATPWLKMHRRFEQAGYRELLRVREGFRRVASGEVKSGYCEARYGVAYRADGHVDWNENVTRIYDVTEQPGSVPMQFDPPPWSPSTHMRNYESRLTLEVTGTKLERFHEISNEDAEAEGFEGGYLDDGWDEPRAVNDAPGVTIQAMNTLCSAAGMAQIYYHEQYPDPSWDAYSSPECVALTFKVHRCNVDEVRL